MTRGRGLVLAVVLVVLAGVSAGAVAWTHRHGRPDPCAGTASTPRSRSLAAPLATGARLRSELGGDPRLRTLAGRLGALGGPFGPVAAGIGYDYDRYLTLGGLGDAIAVWSRRSPSWQVLDPETLAPRWAASIPRAGMSWDTSGSSFVAVRAGMRATATTYDQRTGRRHWCVALPGAARNDQIATAGLDGGDVLVALPAGRGTSLTRLAGRGGRRRWSVHTTTGGDTAADLGGGRVVVGGQPAAALYDGDTSSTRPAGRGSGLSTRDADTGREVWHWSPPSGAAHVVGTVPGAGLTVLQTATGGTTTLLALDRDGRQAWVLPPRSGAVQAALKGSVLLVRGAGAGGHDVLASYDVGSGRALWHSPIRSVPQYFPYGFELSSVPSLDADHVLLPTTDALVSLDLRTGAKTSYALPTDGVSTTYWPYQVVVTDRLIGVVTNTGAVVVKRVG